MSYGNNWLRHLVAPLTGNSWSNELARDFWPSEDLWDPRVDVSSRWLKLAWVYAASALSQVTFLAALIIAVLGTFQGAPVRWWVMIVGGIALAGVLFSLFFALMAYIDISRRRSR